MTSDPKPRGPLMPEDFRREHEQVNGLLEEVRRLAVSGDPGAMRRIEERLKDVGQRVQTDWRKAKDAINGLVRLQTAQGLAPLFMERRNPYKGDPHLSALMEEGLLDRATFIQKPPHLLSFYQWLFRGMESEPKVVLEIGVKGGGSAAFWKAIFPNATVL